MAFVPDGHKQSILKILNGLPQEGADAVLRTLKFQMEANPDNPVRDATRYTAVLAKKFKTGELIVAGTHVDNEKAILSKQIELLTARWKARKSTPEEETKIGELYKKVGHPRWMHWKDWTPQTWG